jgi:hypothetical protein
MAGGGRDWWKRPEANAIGAPQRWSQRLGSATWLVGGREKEEELQRWADVSSLARVATIAVQFK